MSNQLRDFLLFSGGEEEPSKEPEEFEIHCMDIFLHFDQFNDGYLTKSDLLVLYDDIQKSVDGDQKKLIKLEKFKSLWESYEESQLVDFVMFATMLHEAEFNADNMNSISQFIYDLNFGGKCSRLLCGCFKNCLFRRLRIKGVTAYIKTSIEAQQKAIEQINHTINTQSKGPSRRINDSYDRLSVDSNENKPKDKVKAADFAQSAMKVQSDITELLDKGSDFYLLYIIYLNGMEIINTFEAEDRAGVDYYGWDKWSYQIVTITMFNSLASNYLISFSSYIYLLLYKGYYNPENFKRLNCCQSFSRFMVLTCLGPLTFVFFQISQVLGTIILFFSLFFGAGAPVRMQDKQYRFYEVNFGLNQQEFDGFSMQQKITQLFFSSLPTAILNILIINGYLDCSKVVEDSPDAIYFSLLLSFVNICSTLLQIYNESKGFEEAYLTYSMNCMNAKTGWIPFIHKIQNGGLNQSINYFLMSCHFPQLTTKLAYYKQFSYQFNDQTIQSLAQDLNLWKQNRESGIFQKNEIIHWLSIGGSVNNVSLNQLLQLLNGIGKDLVEVSLDGINWKRVIMNAKTARMIVQEEGQKYDARTPSHMPCLQICIDAEGYADKDGPQKPVITKELQRYDSSGIQVKASDRGFDNAPSCLVQENFNSKWCLNFTSGQTWAKFTFSEPIDLYAVNIRFANDSAERDPIEWKLQVTTADGVVEQTQNAQTNNEPDRFEEEQCPLSEPLMAKDVTLVFQKTRYPSQLIQICEISFYIPSANDGVEDANAFNLKMVNANVDRQSYQYQLEECFEELLDDGCNPDIANIQGQSMLLYAILHDKPNSLKKLIQFGANIDLPSPNGVSPIQAILQKNNFELFRMMLENQVSLANKVINDPVISQKPVSALHFIAKRLRDDTQIERDGTIFSLLKEFNIIAEGENRKHMFHQACRCLRFDYYPNGDRFYSVFPKIWSLMPNIKLSEQRDIKENNFLHIILKAFSSENSKGLSTNSTLNYVRENIAKFLKNETFYETEEALWQYLSSLTNRDDKIPLQIALEKDNIFGILYVIQFTKLELGQTQVKQDICNWLIRNGSKDLPKEQDEFQKVRGIENVYPLYTQWDNLRETLTALHNDPTDLEKQVLDNIEKTGNQLLLTNLNITGYAIKPSSSYEKKDQSDEKQKKHEKKIVKITDKIDLKLKEFLKEKVVVKKSENWKVVMFMFILELSATFDLLGDFYLLWAMMQKDTAWATLTVYCMITPYFVSYAPLINFQIESWRVKKQEGEDVSGRMKFLAWVTLTPGIVIYLFMMDVVFLLFAAIATPIFFVLHMVTCGKVNFSKMMNSTDPVYEGMFSMKRLDVNGFRRLRTISQLVFESVPQITLQSYILWYSLQPEVIASLEPGEKLLGIDQSVIYASVVFALFHLLMEAALLYAEAKACRTTFLHYLLICLNGRLGWVPFTNILQDQNAAQITANNPLNYDDIYTNILCGKYSLEYEFGDKTASTLAKEIMLLQQSPNPSERASLRLGESLNKVSFSTFLNLLFFSHKRVNLNVDDVDIKSLLLKSNKYMQEMNKAKEENLGGQFLKSIVELGQLKMVAIMIEVGQMELAKVSDGEQLVAIAQKNNDSKMGNLLLSQGIVIKPRPIEGSPNLPEGYRQIYIDELVEGGDETLLRAVKRLIGPWAIIAVFNGWTEGSGYGSKRVKDMNERSKNGGITWMYVNEAYPICDQVKEIYGFK